MTYPTSEAALVAAMVRAIKKAHPTCWVFKVVGSPYQETGIPDLLVCVQGLLVGIEAKHLKPGETREHAIGRATPGQRVQIGRINRAGGMAGVATTVSEALEIIERGLTHRLKEKYGQMD